MANIDHRTELDGWIEMWDEAEKEGLIPSLKKEVPTLNPVSDKPTTPQDDYYTHLDLLQEMEHKIPNPIYPDSVGPDYTNTDPKWVNENLLKEVEKLKVKLFDVENKLASQMGGNKKWVEKAHIPEDKKLMSEIESIRKKVEELSSRLGIENEPSPWVVKRG